jgi:S-adenosylmethionine:tRNA ribosyltransferase-isomerase
MDISRFDYDLPGERIAQTPIEPRHASRLLDTRDLSDHVFLDLPGLLRSGDLLVVNRTRVRAARLIGTKRQTGGRVEALLVRRFDDGSWEAMVRPARRLRAGAALRFGDLAATVESEPADGVVRLSIDADPSEVEEAIEAVGEVPLPPYITEPLADPTRYQTMFAERPGSAAAPTAGLHFTQDVLERLSARGIELATVDLDVGLATFRPIASERIEDHAMHSERCRIDESAAAAIAECRQRGGRVVAVGTTVVRTLETFGRGDATVETGERDTDLYLRPGSRFDVVDLLVTNFHLPRSSLLVLIEAFMGERWRTAYQVALERGYRFLSFGDAMLAERV